jgi:lysophospholipase L1-like esterase
MKLKFLIIGAVSMIALLTPPIPLEYKINEILDAVNQLNERVAFLEAQALPPNIPYESIYTLAKEKDLTIVGYGDSIMQGYSLPNYTGLDGELQPKGLKNFMNLFYLQLLKKTANFLQPDKSNFTTTNGTGGIWDSPTENAYYFTAGQVMRLIYPYDSTNATLTFDYYGKDITIWGTKSKDNALSFAACDVYIDGALAGEIDQYSTTLNTSFYPFTFVTTEEKLHRIELKNFKNKQGAVGGSLYFDLTGVSNREHKLYNESYGTMGTTWGLANLQSRVLDKNPDVLIIEFGDNDGYMATGVDEGISAEQFETNLTTMVTNVQTALPNCKIALMNIVPATYNTRHSEVLANYYPAVLRVAQNKNCKIIDIWNMLSEVESTLWRTANDVHPNEYGHKLIYDAISKALSPEILQ